MRHGMTALVLLSVLFATLSPALAADPAPASALPVAPASPAATSPCLRTGHPVACPSCGQPSVIVHPSSCCDVRHVTCPKTHRPALVCQCPTHKRREKAVDGTKPAPECPILGRPTKCPTCGELRVVFHLGADCTIFDGDCPVCWKPCAVIETNKGKAR